MLVWAFPCVFLHWKIEQKIHFCFRACGCVRERVKEQDCASDCEYVSSSVPVFMQAVNLSMMWGAIQCLGRTAVNELIGDLMSYSQSSCYLREDFCVLWQVLIRANPNVPDNICMCSHINTRHSINHSLTVSHIYIKQAHLHRENAVIRRWQKLTGTGFGDMW